MVNVTDYRKSYSLQMGKFIKRVSNNLQLRIQLLTYPCMWWHNHITYLNDVLVRNPQCALQTFHLGVFLPAIDGEVAASNKSKVDVEFLPNSLVYILNAGLAGRGFWQLVGEREEDDQRRFRLG